MLRKQYKPLLYYTFNAICNFFLWFQENLYENLAKDLATFGKFEMKKNNGKETKFVIEPNALDKENSSQIHSQELQILVITK